MLVDEWAPDSDGEQDPHGGGSSLAPMLGGLPQPEALGLPQPEALGGLPQPEALGGLPEPPAVQVGKGRGRGRGRSTGRGGGTGRGRSLGGLLGSRMRRLKRGVTPALAAPTDGGLPQVSRKLKRRGSDQRPEAVSAEQMICVWGGDVKKPVPVYPVSKELGTTWFTLTEHCAWLRRACSSKGLTHYKELFQSAVSALRRELQAGMTAIQQPDPAAELRASLNLEIDDIDDGQPAACPKKSPRKRQPPERARTLEVQLGDATIKVQNQMRPFRVEVTESSVRGIIEWCQEHVMQGKPVLKKHRATEACPGEAQSSWSMPLDSCPSILGKVTWQPSHSGWCVHAKNEDGVIVKTRVKGSTPGSFLKSGRDDYYSDRKQAYLQAIELWNLRDKSTRDRIVVPTA